MIKRLITTGHGSALLGAIDAIRHRIDANTTIMFTHGDPGLVEQINRHYFPDLANRPSGFLGLSTWKFIPLDETTRDLKHVSGTIYDGIGSLKMGSLFSGYPGEAEERLQKRHRNVNALKAILKSAPILSARSVPEPVLRHVRISQIIEIDISNAMTTLFDCSGHEMLDGEDTAIYIGQTRRQLFDKLFIEAAAVMKQYDPELDLVAFYKNLLERVAYASYPGHMRQRTKCGKMPDIDGTIGWFAAHGCSTHQIVANRLRQMFSDMMIEVYYEKIGRSPGIAQRVILGRVFA